MHLSWGVSGPGRSRAHVEIEVGLFRMQSPVQPGSSAGQESIIVCRNSQGASVRGSLMHFSNQTAVFEVYNPFSILQLSEVLMDFRIMIGERSLYAGRAVVSSLMNTGIMLLCEATLVDAWSDVDVLSIFGNKEAIRTELRRFVTEWRTRSNILPDFKVFTGDFQGFLTDLNLWMRQVEVTLGQAETLAGPAMVELVEKVVDPLRPVAAEFFQGLESLANRIDPDLAGMHKAFLRSSLHPLTLCAPFVHRSFTKPLGYAGDYEMINMILERPYEGRTLFAKVINKLVLEASPAEAHRNRIVILHRLLTQENARAARNQTRLDVLNIGCGPAKEVRDFIESSPDSGRCRMTLMDFSKEALEYARDAALACKKERRSEIELKFVEKSIDELLRESISLAPANQIVHKDYDFVYCAGLFDYLTDSVCRRLIALFYEWLRPGGLLCVTNIHPTNPQRHFMEFLLEWNVIHRTEAEFDKLGPPDVEKEVIADPTGVNIFLNLRKPG